MPQVLSPAYQYGLSLLNNPQSQRTAPNALGALSVASNPIVGALLAKKGFQQDEQRQKDMAQALLQYQQNIQTESLPTGINPTPPVQMGEDPSLRDYSSVIQQPSQAEAMGRALMASTNPDFVNQFGPGIVQAQAEGANLADQRRYEMAQMLSGQRFNRAQQMGQQGFAAAQAQQGRDFTAGEGALNRQAAVDAATATRDFTASQNQMNRDATAANAQATRDAAATQAQLNRDTTLRAAEIRRGSRFLPPSAAKLENDDIAAVQTANNIGADLGAVGKQITDGQLPLGMMSNAVNAGRNFMGMSTDASRNFASFKATMEKLRNDSLRLNAGVQTEGDAVRAWNELFANINDERVVSQRIQEIQAINERAAAQRMQQIQIRRNTYGAEPLDEGQFQSAPAIGQGPKAQQPQAQGDPLAEARDAIARGAPRDAVIQRLRQNGINPAGL